ncbi:ABC transporter substrate-binding protein [bacterium]|nr:MAG: ABC transporter substrate-binding protein [bacterium]
MNLVRVRRSAGAVGIVALALFLCLSLPAAAQQAPKELIQPGTLTYGTAATFAPFEYQDNGSLVGFDIEFGAAITKALNLQPNVVNMDFNGLIPALQGKRIDIINSAMYINPKRAEQVDFIPYMRIGNELVVRKGNPKDIHSRTDLCGKTAAVTLGAIEEIYAREDSKRCQDAGKGVLTILTLPTAQDSIIAVRSGRAEVFYDSTPGATKAVNELPDVFEIAGPQFETKTQIGIAVRKGDTAMKQAIERAIQTVVRDGTYNNLLKKYHLPESGSLYK